MSKEVSGAPRLGNAYTRVKPNISASAALAYMAGALFLLASAAINVRYALCKADDLVMQIIWSGIAVAASAALALAPSAIIENLRMRRFGATNLTLLSLTIFGAYSIASALGAATGGRLVSELEAGDIASRRKDALALIAKADGELATIGAVQAAGMIEADVNSIFARTPGLDDCSPRPNWTPSKAIREACKQVAALGIEKASADRKAELELTASKARDVLANLRAGKTVANSDALALQGFAAAAGISVSVDSLNRLLVVLAVLVIELGGGLAIAIAQSFTSNTDEPRKIETAGRTQRTQVFEPISDDCTSRTPANSSIHGPETPANTFPKQPVPVNTRRDVSERLLALLREQGGELETSIRSAAVRIGAKPPTVHAAINALLDAGTISVEHTSKGTRLRLLEALAA